MPPPDIIYLSQQQVIDLAPTPAESIDLVAGVLAEHGAGEYENPPKPGIHPLADTFIHAMPGYLPRRSAAGMKWVSGFFGNPARGLPSISGVIVLNDAQTGIPIAIMDAAYITALRTAATSAVAARHLARPDSAILGIVGAGVQGRYNLLTIKQTVPALACVRVYDVNPDALRRFAKTMGELADVRIEPADSIQAALDGADILLTATGQLHSVLFHSDWVKPGALVLPVHSAGWEPRTLHQADKFVVDDIGQFRASLGGPKGFYGELPVLHAQLGEIVAGLRPGRQRDDERIIDFNYGIAIQDVGMASEVLRRAKEAGIGTALPQLDGKFPFTQ